VERLLSREKTALVVVDMQNALCKAEGSMAQAGIDIGPLTAAVDPCRRLLTAARNAGVRAIFTRYVYRADYADDGILIK
jgi:nicotinamidase-related amidase